MHQAGFEAHVGRENIVEHVQAALDRARVLHDRLEVPVDARPN